MSFKERKEFGDKKETVILEYLELHLNDCKAYITEEVLKFSGLYSNHLGSINGDVIAVIGDRTWRFEVKTQKNDGTTFISETCNNNFVGCGFIIIPWDDNIDNAWFVPRESINKIFAEKINANQAFDKGRSNNDGYYLNMNEQEMATPFQIFVEQLNMRSKMYENTDLKLVTDCERCEFHKGIGNKYVRCGSSDGIITLVITFIAHNLEGFINGAGILYCPKNKVK